MGIMDEALLSKIKAYQPVFGVTLVKKKQQKL